MKKFAWISGILFLISIMLVLAWLTFFRPKENLYPDGTLVKNETLTTHTCA